MGMLFSYSRSEGLPTNHGDNKTPVTVDVLEVGFILAFVILAFTYFIIILGKRGKAQLFLLIRVIISLFVGVVIMIGNFGQEWEVSDLEIQTPYKSGSAQEINATIGMKLGLRSVNITLKRTDVVDQESNDPLKGEIIDYNERFSWTWDQGRFGFGPYAGRLQQEFREAQLKGLPFPILWVADYFTWDGEGLRFGRHYRTAGWYAHIAMWAALPCWAIANLLYLSILSHAAYYTLLTGALQLLACLIWSTIRNPEPLRIPFGDREMFTKFGVSFWLTFSTGILCIIIGIVVLILDLRFPNQIADFFGIDPLAVYEEYHLTESEMDYIRDKKRQTHLDMVTVSSDAHHSSPVERTQVILKRRTTVRVAQKNLVRKPLPVPKIPDEPVYLNVQQQQPTRPQYADEVGSYHSRERLHQADNRR